jgi:DNA-binding MarR family transcriptional regulator
VSKGDRTQFVALIGAVGLLLMEGGALGAPNQAPVFAGAIADLQVVGGESNLSALDLSAYFSDPDGDALTYSAQIVGGYDATQADVTLAVNGTLVDLRSGNASWWGALRGDFFAQDTQGQITESNNVTIHVIPAPLNETRSEARLFGLEGLGMGCGFYLDVPWGPIPANAVITTATIQLANGRNATALDATLNVTSGASLIGSANTSNLPLELQLNATVLTAEIHGLPSEWGTVEIRIKVTGCPIGGIAELWIGFVNLTYTRSSQGGASGPWPAAPFISFNGAVTASVDSDATLTIGLQSDQPFPPGAQVNWFVDGVLVGHGQALSNVTFAPGEHRVEARVQSGGTVRSYFTSVSARPRVTVGDPNSQLVATVAILGLLTFGVAAARTERGSWLILGVVVGSVFARLKRDSLLDHFIRGTLYQVIRENPGIHFAEIRRRTQLANGVASHHLRVLEKGGYIRVVVDGTKTKFYTTDRPMEPEVYGISDTDRAILTPVTDTPGIGQGDLAIRLDRSPSAISRSVAHLTAVGFVTTTHDGARVNVFLRPGAETPDPLAPTWPDEGA